MPVARGENCFGNGWVVELKDGRTRPAAPFINAARPHHCSNAVFVTEMRQICRGLEGGVVPGPSDW